MINEYEIYLNNASTTLKKPPAVAEAVFHAISDQNFANPSRGFNFSSQNAAHTVFNARKTVAELFNITDPRKIVFTENVTAALNIAIRSFVSQNAHIITTENEHNSVLRPLYQHGNLSFVRLNPDGTLRYKDFIKNLKPETEAVVVSHASNVSGIITDIDYIYEFCRKYNLLLIVDGAQSAGHFKIDLSNKEDTVYCFTGHKGLYGPQGTGGMIVITDRKAHEVFSGGTGFDSFNHFMPDTLPEIFETGTRNIPAIAGLCAGIKFIQNFGIDKIEKDDTEKINRIIHALKQNKNIELYHNTDVNRVAIVSFNYKGLSSEETEGILSSHKISVRSGIHCAPLHHKAMHTENRGMVRVSLSIFNTDDEIRKFLEIIREI